MNLRPRSSTTQLIKLSERSPSDKPEKKEHRQGWKTGPSSNQRAEKKKMNDPEDNIQDLWDTIKRLNSQICHKRGNFDTD